MAGDGDGAESGEDFLFALERAVDNCGGCSGAGATPESTGDATTGVGAADGVVDHGASIDLVGVGRPGDDLEGVMLAEGGCGAGVVDMSVGEEEVGGSAVAGEIEDFLDDGISAAGKAGVDEREVVVFEFDREDIAASGAVQPPDAWDDAVCHGCSSVLAAMSVCTFVWSESVVALSGRSLSCCEG